MRTLHYNPDGIHITEMFADYGVTDMLPVLIPVGDEPGEEWDEELTGIFARIGE